jgi:hypothetical protein
MAAGIASVFGQLPLLAGDVHVKGGDAPLGIAATNEAVKVDVLNALRFGTKSTTGVEDPNRREVARKSLGESVEIEPVEEVVSELTRFVNAALK